MGAIVCPFNSSRSALESCAQISNFFRACNRCLCPAVILPSNTLLPSADTRISVFLPASMVSSSATSLAAGVLGGGVGGGDFLGPFPGGRVGPNEPVPPPPPTNPPRRGVAGRRPPPPGGGAGG